MVEAGDFWTVEEVAIYLRLPRSTIYKLSQDKVLPGFKVGKHWRFRREAVLEWIDQREKSCHTSRYDNSTSAGGIH